MTPLRILHTVERYPPSIGGMQEVVRQLSERLARMGHDVTVATGRVEGRSGTVVNGVTIREFDVSGNLVEGLAGDVADYREFLSRGGFQVTTNFAAQQWATDVAITVLDSISGKKVFVPTGFSKLYSPAYRGYYRSMAGWMRRYDANVFLSETYRDASFAREQGIGNRVLIPNGAGEDEFLRDDGIDLRARLGIPGDAFLVLHVGAHTGDKGHREALAIYRKARIANAVFLLVGNDTGGCLTSCRREAAALNLSADFRRRGKKVLVESLARADTVAAFRAADLFLFPSNIECSPLVLFECLASRTPFLSTDVGNAAEIAAWTSAGAILPTDKGPEEERAENPIVEAVRRVASAVMPRSRPVPPGHARARTDESAMMLEKLYADSDARGRMAEAGHEAWTKRFTWEKIARRYEALYAALASGERPPW